MPEIIDNDLLIQGLRYIDYCRTQRTKDLPFNCRSSTLAVITRLLRDRGLISRQGALTTRGRTFLKKQQLGSYLTSRYTPFGYVYRKRSSRINRQIIKILQGRPKPNARLDQQPLPPQLTIMRAEYISSEENLFDKTIAFVGDYDSTNVAMSLLSKTKDMYVFDIDDRLLKFFNQVARRNASALTTVRCNIFTYRSKKFAKKFDIVVSDPPYAIGGIEKFIQFSISLLRDNGVGYLAVPFHENISWTEQMLFRVTRILERNNCLITDMKKNFYYYPEADNLKSSVIRFKKIVVDRTLNIKRLYSYKASNINAPVVRTRRNIHQLIMPQ